MIRQISGLFALHRVVDPELSIRGPEPDILLIFPRTSWNRLCFKILHIVIFSFLLSILCAFFFPAAEERSDDQRFRAAGVQRHSDHAVSASGQIHARDEALPANRAEIRTRQRL